jgi:tetratricopeptide (TPR) repeat protein
MPPPLLARLLFAFATASSAAGGTAWDRHDPAAARLLAAATAADPTCAPCWSRLGGFALDAGDLGAAEPALRRATALAPALPEPHYLLGQLLLQRGDRTRARAELLGATRLDPQTGAHHDLADLLVETGQPDAARAEYAADLDRYPECYESRVNLAALELAAGHAAEAVRQYRVSLTYHPGDPRAERGLLRARLHAALPVGAPAALAVLLCSAALAMRWRRGNAKR